MFSHSALIDQMDGLRRFALRLTRDPADADDLLQSTVLRAYEKKHLFEDGSNLFGWTSKIMFNLFVSEYHRKVRYSTQHDPQPYIEHESVSADQEMKIALQEVSYAMDEISPDHRDILIMVCVKGMQYAEVSEALQIPIGTVRSRLFRARECLQNALTGSDQGLPGSMVPPVAQTAFAQRLAA